MSQSVFYHENQISCANEIIQTITRGVNWVVMIARPQSGKSGTYLYVVCDLVLSGHYEKAIIMSGVPDLKLRSQTRRNVRNGIISYVKLHRRDGKIKTSLGDIEYYEAISMLQNKIRCRFATDIKGTNSTDFQNALIVHDESHFAQGTINFPWKHFFSKSGLGGMEPTEENISHLKKMKTSILSVSATPDSEIHNKYHSGDMSRSMDLQKHFVKLQPGDGYNSFENMNCVWVNPKEIGSWDHIRSIINNPKYKGKIIIIRTRNITTDAINLRSMVTCPELCYYQISGKKGNENNFDVLDEEPMCHDLPFIVHICGTGRLGQEFATSTGKKYIGAVYESGKNSKKDTLVQALPGRVSGYHSNTDIDIYVTKSRKLELESYIVWFSSPVSEWGVTSKSLGSANKVNLSKSTGNSHSCTYLVRDKDGYWWKKLVPIQLTLGQIDHNQFSGNGWELTLKQKMAQFMVQYLSQHLVRNTEMNAILSDMKKFISDNIGIFGVRKLEGSSYVNTYVEQTLKDAIKYQSRSTGRFTNMISDYQTFDDRAPREINGRYVICVGEKRDCFYLVGYHRFSDQCRCGLIHKLRPTVHASSIYNKHACEIESGDLLMTNGKQPILFRIETCSDPALFKQELIESIKLSRKNKRRIVPMIQSVWDNRREEYKPIYLDKSRFKDDLLDILHSIEETENISFGSPIEYRESSQFYKFAAIKWSFNPRPHQPPQSPQPLLQLIQEEQPPQEQDQPPQEEQPQHEQPPQQEQKEKRKKKREEKREKKREKKRKKREEKKRKKRHLQRHEKRKKSEESSNVTTTEPEKKRAPKKFRIALRILKPTSSSSSSSSNV